MNTHKQSKHAVKSYVLFIAMILSISFQSFAQTLPISDFVIFSGNGGSGTTSPPSPGYGVQMGASTTVSGGSIGAYSLIQSTGTASIGANIYSDGKVTIANSNVISGKISARNSSNLTGTILSVGSSANLGGDIDVKGNIVVGGGTVSGRVTHPSGTTYTGPNPAGGNIVGTPTHPVLPSLPAITVFPAAGNSNISSTTTLSPGNYKNLTL
ncbi:MAG TPA: polymer-forming cytoskeletal protein, partial [Bacteroidia bacterium]|nr:polymer-forming cytoskeletal protein [Bacteroidia bacterium]